MLTLVLFFMLGQALQMHTAYWVIFSVYATLTVLYDIVKTYERFKDR